MCYDITSEDLHLAIMAGMDDITFDDLPSDDLKPDDCEYMVLRLII